MNVRCAVRLAVAAATVFAVLPASAQFFLNFTNVASGDTPTGGPVFARLQFEDAGVNRVRMRLSHSATALSAQFLTSVRLNISPFTNVTVAADPVADPNYKPITDWDSENNGVNAPMGTRFDLRVDFTTSNNGSRLTPGTFSQWTVTGTNLTAQRFASRASQGEPWYGVVRIQGIGKKAEGSAWVAAPVPEPGTMVALAAGLAALAARRRKRA